MILVLDTAGLVSYANRRCSEAGYGEGELLGKPLADMAPRARRSILLAALGRTLEGVAIDNLEIPLRIREGIERRFSVSLSPMRDDDGAINSIVVVMSDITDAADLQAKLMHTEKMAALGQLVSGVAHEVNNPLAAIVGFTDLLLENPVVPEAAKEELRIILEESQRTRVIVHNLLSFARQTPPQREPLQVNLVLQQTVRLRTYDFANHGVEIREKYREDLPIVLGDPHQLQQVFLNILNNAYDAVQETERPGKIEIETSAENGSIEIVFRDNGPGIAHPDRIFDPFFTTKEVGKGTGLGLSICYGILRAHRGEILAANDPKGVGCTFRVRLPLAATPAEVLTAEA
jgi:two-component system NtrC family sensor kinase